ncbi:MAG: hypothetical protein A2V70_11155 [Planctomycetes bacterium RBG_13_63_9]|nr:MAG: hypothetical protein A2V70_11155 [Planctomycetes bacterium RBG_13_63_9]
MAICGILFGMSHDTPCEIEIAPVAPDARVEALGLVFAALPAQQRSQYIGSLLAGWHGHACRGQEGVVEKHAHGKREHGTRAGRDRLTEREQGSAAGLLGAYRGGRLVGAVFSQIQPGKTALVWPPQLVPDEPRPTACGLLDATSRWLGGQEVRIAQAMLPSSATGAVSCGSAGNAGADEAVLLAGGFERMADLLYLVSEQSEFPDGAPRSPLQFESYSSANHQRLDRVVLATYEDTLDCPSLDGVRKIGDVLEGYRATGVFDPRRWLIVRHEGKDIGCLLLADHPDQENWELVYMGLVSSHRGRGWGMDIAREAQRLARRAGRRRLVLAVDAGNRPAIETYSAAGFRLWDRRGVYVKVL